MDDLLQQALNALFAKHGDALLAQPELLAQALHEAVPGYEDDVRLLTAALADGVPTRLAGSLDGDAVGREVEAFARRPGVSDEQARRVVEAWAVALRPADAASAAPLVPLGDITPPDTAASDPREETAARLWLGMRCGGGAGLLTGAAVAMLCLFALSASNGNYADLPLDLMGWMLLAVTVGGVAGMGATAARLSERPELIGAAAGSAVGLLGGLLYIPVAAALPGAADPMAREVGGALLGVLVCLIAGGVLGVFHDALLRLLFKALCYRRRSGLEVMLGIRRWNDEGLFDPNQQEWNRRAGL